MTKPLKTILIASGIMLVAVGAALGANVLKKGIVQASPEFIASNSLAPSPSTRSATSANANNSLASPSVEPANRVAIHLEHAADFDPYSDQYLITNSDNIFVGRVIRQIGEKAFGTTPQTQFEVAVMLSIKGELVGSPIIINQLGGYKNGVLYYVEDASPLPEVGATYLFAGGYSKQYQWYSVFSYPQSRKLISNSANLADDQLKGLAEADNRVQQLQAAVAPKAPALSPSVVSSVPSSVASELKLTLGVAAYQDSYGQMSPSRLGGKLVIVNFEVKDAAAGASSLTQDDMRLIAPNGSVLPPVGWSNGVLGTQLAAGGTLKGDVVFEVDGTNAQRSLAEYKLTFGRTPAVRVTYPLMK